MFWNFTGCRVRGHILAFVVAALVVAGLGGRDALAQTGACCAFDADSFLCSVGSASSCPAGRGHYLGDGTTCTAGICDQFRGACCLIDAERFICQFVNTPFCMLDGGIYLGNGTTCTPNPCVQFMGACCLIDANTFICLFVNESFCLLDQGTYLGNGTTCMPDPCVQFLGACCVELIAATNTCYVSNVGFCLLDRGHYFGDGTTCTAGLCDQFLGACCVGSGPTSVCSVINATFCQTATGSYLGNGTSCAPSPCLPRACCNLITGACSVTPALVACPTGTRSDPGGAGTCTPSPCVVSVGLGCSDCTYVNGSFDGRDGQLSHLGGASPSGSKAADDLFLCENFVYDLRTFSATIFTTTTPGLVKPKGEIWTDCNGCPGELLYTFENPLVIETGASFGAAFDGRALRIVNVTFDVNREANLANKNVVLKGGRYWVSIYGRSDNLGPSQSLYDVTYWGTTAGPIKGKPAYKIDGLPGQPYNQYAFPAGCGPAAWHSFADGCCIGCTDLNFSFCTTPCKILLDNGAGRRQVGTEGVGSTSQFAAGSFSAAETRTADDFVVPPCQDYRICYIEGCVLTNCPTFDGAFEIYANDCNKPSYALHGSPLQSGIATKIIDLGYSAILDGRSVRAYKLEFHDLSFVLSGGRQYWLSVGVKYTFSIVERAYFCYNADCNRSCLIRWNNAKVLTATSIEAGTVNTLGWADTGNDTSFLIAADGLSAAGPIGATPGCRADFNIDGVLTAQDVFDYLNAWFVGCP